MMSESVVLVEGEEFIEWEKVESSQLDAIHYAPSVKRLFIRFKGGGVYEYAGVPEMVVDAFRQSQSKGTFFGKQIKNAYQTKKIAVPAPAFETEIVPLEAVKPDLPKLEAEALTLIDLANSITVSNKEEAEIAVKFVQHRQSVLSAFVEWFAPIKKASWDAHKRNTEKEGSIKDPNELAIKIVKQKLLDYEAEQARIALAETNRIRAEEEARERARREKEEADRRARQKLEDEARAKEESRIRVEREKLEAEKKAQADALAKAGKEAEAENIRKRAAAEAEIQKLLDEGRRLKEENERLEEERHAQELLTAPIHVVACRIQPDKIEGLTMAYPWKAEVVDIRALCRGIAEGKTPADVISVKQSKLDALAKTWKESTGDHYPGIRGKEDRSVRI